MEKKKLIQIVVIIVAFAGTAYVLYSNFFKSGSAPAVPINLASNAPGGSSGLSAPILPFGSKLDFGLLDKKRFKFEIVNFEKVDASSEVGILKSQLIVPPAQ